MATPLSNAFISINSVNLSTLLRSITPSFTQEMLESTTMGDSGREKTPGLTDGSLDCEFVQSFAAGETDATLWAARGSVVPIAFRYANSAIATTNPEYQFSGVIESYSPMAGRVGDLGIATCRILISGAVTRDTTP